MSRGRTRLIMKFCTKDYEKFPLDFAISFVIN